MRISIALFATLLAACGGGSPGNDEAIAGPCIVTYADPVFLIVDVRSSLTSVPVSDFRIEAIKVGTIAYPLSAAQGQLRNATVQANAVQCRIPCGFAVGEGDYSFTVSATGFQPKALQISAKYAIFAGGCPASYSGPTSVSITLDPSS